MKKTILLAALINLPFLLAPMTSAGGTTAVPPEEAARVLAKAFSTGADIYKKYRGIESLRKEVLREYDPETGALRSTSEVTTRRKEYYYAMPEIEVVTYKKDGKETEPSKFRVWKALPIYPVFDARGREHYTVTITDRKKISGSECYRVQVEPKENTSRHFKGNIYITVRTLEMVSIEGTMAKLDFPLKEFRLELSLVQQGTVPVARKGVVRLRVHVPIFFPDTIIESVFEVMENRPIE
jgi:hypothetical protein